MEEKTKPARGHKITIRVLAAGCTAGWLTMFIPQAKDTLDFVVYGIPIMLFAIIRALLFLGAIGFGVITGGTYLTNIKGNGRNGDG